MYSASHVFSSITRLLSSLCRRYRSLDDLWYFGGGSGRHQVAVHAHSPSNENEVALEAGDTLGILGNHWDGYSKGINERTRQKGLYPAYKARDVFVGVDIPLLDAEDG